MYMDYLDFIDSITIDEVREFAKIQDRNREFEWILDFLDTDSYDYEDSQYIKDYVDGVEEFLKRKAFELHLCDMGYSPFY